MYEVTFYLLLVTAIVFLLLGLTLEGIHDYWFIASLGISMIIFLALSAAVMNIEIPYQMYNATSGTIETGYQVHGYDYSLSYLFLGIAVFESIYILVYLFEYLGLITLDLDRRHRRIRR